MTLYLPPLSSRANPAKPGRTPFAVTCWLDEVRGVAPLTTVSVYLRTRQGAVER